MCGQPEQPVLIRHASHIRDLTLNLRSASAAPLVSKATSLHSLLVKAKIDPVALKSKVWITVKGLLKNNPHLYALQFDCLPHPYDIRRLPLDLSPSLPPRLMELRLKFAILDLAHLKGLSTLAVLDLQDCIIESYPHEREGPPMFPVLETLVLHGHGADYISHSALDWMAHCPRLKGLILVDYQPNPKMSSSISHWSPSLTLDSLRHSLVLDDERQAQLISKFPRLTSIMVQGDAAFGEKTFRAGKMNGLWESIRVLVLGEGQKQHPAAIMSILGAAPLLRSLHCQRMDAADLPKNTGSGSLTTMPRKPQWACTELELISVDEFNWSKDKAQNRHMQEELKALKDLRDISLTTSPSADATPAHNNKDDQSGQSQDPIKLWKRGLYVPTLIEQKPAMRWMLRTWPHLRYYSNGNKNSEHVFDGWLSW
ncbi:hypothetical protein EMPS_06620 [Entomortierella parvispora]|uniref:Uncharacterized protein n=1 Tax=Entomortierella parvispora TaxID=205924 RepID=A0A9P3HCS1_9FUNG|nr:hypothetical protein EMPS_06620 [Entomortierella parvispora]